MGYQSHQLVRESISEMINEGNRTLIISRYDENQSDEDSWKEYESKTRWNDFNIGVPLLYNFYHGLELIMKGVLQELKEEIVKTHNLKSLFERISKNDTIPVNLLIIFKKYLFTDNPFLDFFESNDIQTHQYHLLLKYPESLIQNKPKTHNYSKLRGKKEVGLSRFETLKEDISIIKNCITEWNISKV